MELKSSFLKSPSTSTSLRSPIKSLTRDKYKKSMTFFRPNKLDPLKFKDGVNGPPKVLSPFPFLSHKYTNNLERREEKRGHFCDNSYKYKCHCPNIEKGFSIFQ